MKVDVKFLKNWSPSPPSTSFDGGVEKPHRNY